MIITSLDLLSAVLITQLQDEINLHHCDWVLLSHVQLFVHEEPRSISAKKPNSPQPMFLPCSSLVPGAEKLHLAQETSVSSFLQHLKIPLNSGSAHQHIGHCSNGMSSAGCQRKPPGLLFMLLMKVSKCIDPTVSPSCKPDGESAEHYFLNWASLSPKLLFTGLVQMSAIWLPGRMMKGDKGRAVVRIYLDCILAVAVGHDLSSWSLCWQFLVTFLGFVCLELVSK